MLALRVVMVVVLEVSTEARCMLGFRHHLHTPNTTPHNHLLPVDGNRRNKRVSQSEACLLACMHPHRHHHILPCPRNRQSCALTPRNNARTFRTVHCGALRWHRTVAACFTPLLCCSTTTRSQETLGGLHRPHLIITSNPRER